jgi:RNA polymerase sigma factor (sigma-70 family)
MGTTAELKMCGSARGEDQEDNELVARFQAGDGTAFDRLVLGHQGRVVRLAYRLLGRPHEVDDVVQEVFLSVLENVKRFRGECRFSTWLTRIVVNKCRSHQRWRLRRLRLWLAACRRLGRLRLSSEEGPFSDPSSPANDAVCHAVNLLPAKYREAVVLRYFEDLSIAEIGQALGISAGAVDVRLTRARQKLKRMLGDRGVEG